MATKKQSIPLIKEVMLGKSIEDLINEHWDHIEFTDTGIWELGEVVKSIITMNTPNLRFGVDVSHDYCDIITINPPAGDALRLEGYWDEDYNSSKDEDAWFDCKSLNEIVESLFAKTNKRKPKLSQSEFIRLNGADSHKVCPFCLGKKLIVLDRVTWTNKVIMGCKKCGQVWNNLTREIVMGFEFSEEN